MLDRREALASIAAIAGAGATCHAVEQKPNEPKLLFYVVKLDECYEDPTDHQIERLRDKFREVAGEDAKLLVLPPNCELLKCTDLPNVPELQTATRPWWRKALGL